MPSVFRSQHPQLVIVCMLLSLLLCGCPESRPTGGNAAVALPFRGQEVELLVPKSLDLPSAWEVLLAEWSSQTGATTRWVEYSGEDPFQGTDRSATAAPSGGRIIVFPLGRLSEVAGELAPVELAAGSEFDLKDFFKGLRERVLSRERCVVAIPTSAPILACYYRRDLLRTAGRKAPETWEEYLALVESIETWAPGMVAVEPLAPGYRATMWSARSLAYAKHPENYSVWFDIESGSPLIGTPGFFKAAEVANATWSRMPAEIAGMSPVDCRRAVLEGRAALAIGTEPDQPARDDQEVVRQAGIEIGVCRLPGSRHVFNRNSDRWESPANAGVHAPSLCGFDGLAVGVALRQQETKDAAAWNLMTTLVSSQFDAAFAGMPKTVCRESQTSAAGNWSDDALNTEEISHFVDAAAQSLRDTQIVFELPLDQREEFRRAIAASVEVLLQRESEPQRVIAALQSEFERIVGSSGTEAIRRSYRSGLGLAVPVKSTAAP